jgi:alpha-amylase
MLDWVTNQMGQYWNVTQIEHDFYPFGNTSYFHDSCALPYCDDCNVGGGPASADNLWNCRLSGLPDLNQTIPFVQQQLIQWAGYYVETFGFDGIRIDAVSRHRG